MIKFYLNRKTTLFTYNLLFQEGKEHPPMITKENLEMYTKDIDRDLAKLDADYKDQEKKLEEYNTQIKQENLKQASEKKRSIKQKFSKRISILDQTNILQSSTN